MKNGVRNMNEVSHYAGSAFNVCSRASNLEFMSSYRPVVRSLPAIRRSKNLLSLAKRYESVFSFKSVWSQYAVARLISLSRKVMQKLLAVILPLRNGFLSVRFKPPLNLYN